MGKKIRYYDGAQSIAVDDSGNVYSAGITGGYNSSYITTIKYNTNGVQQWVNISVLGSVKKIKSDDLGNVYVTGWYDIGAIEEYVTIKYNSNGVQQWLATYNGPGNLGWANDVAIDAIGNVYVTGISYNTSRANYATVKYNSSGVQQWVQRYIGTGNGYDQAYSISVDSNGSSYITGRTFGPGADYDCTSIKYSTNGVQQWLITYNDSLNGSDVGISISVDKQNEVIVSGKSNSHFLTIKYAQLNSVQPIASDISKEYKLYQNYPNPFNTSTNIQFSIESQSFISLKIFNSLGEEIENVINEELKPGLYTYNWNSSKNSSSVYFYKLTSELFTETKKMVLMK